MTSTPPRLYIVRLRTLLDVHSPLLLYDVQVPILHKDLSKTDLSTEARKSSWSLLQTSYHEKRHVSVLNGIRFVANLASQPATLSCVMFILLNLRRLDWLVSVTLEEKERCSRISIGNGEKHQPHTLKQAGYM